MQKALKTCRNCGAPIRVARSVPSDRIVCGRCDPTDEVIEPVTPNQPAEADFRRLTAIGLMFFAPGLTICVFGELIVSLPNPELRRHPAFFTFGSVLSILGFLFLSTSGLLCLFAPKDSNAAKNASIAFVGLLTVILYRLVPPRWLAFLFEFDFERIRMVSASLIMIWLVLWTGYFSRITKSENIHRLGILTWAVLPALAICLTISFIVSASSTIVSDFIPQMLRLIIFCCGLFISVLALIAGYQMIRTRQRQLLQVGSQQDSISDNPSQTLTS